MKVLTQADIVDGKLVKDGKTYMGVTSVVSNVNELIKLKNKKITAYMNIDERIVDNELQPRGVIGFEQQNY